MKFAWMIAFAVSLAACAEDGTLVVRDDDVDAGREVALDQEFTMEVGDMVAVDGSHLLIRFVGVDEDSRCPSDVQCPWAGNAEVRLEFSSDNAEFAPQQRVVNTSLEPRSVEFMGMTIAVVDLTPYPISTQQIDPASYVVKLIVTRP